MNGLQAHIKQVSQRTHKAMARRKSQVTALPIVSETEGGIRLVTPESGIPQELAQIQLIQWMTEMGDASTVMQASKYTEIEVPKPGEVDANTTTRKIIFLTQIVNPSQPVPTIADVVHGNRSQQQGLKLEYYPLIIREGVKVVRLNQIEVDEQTQK